MAKYRQVHTTFWDDGFVIDLTPEEKYFYLYLMTNNNTTQCGIYELPYRVIEMHTGYNRDTVMKLLQRFKEYKKIEYNEPTKEIILTNWARYNFINSPKVKKCIEKELLLVKHKPFVNQYIESLEENGYPIDTVSIPYPYPIDTVSIPYGNGKTENSSNVTRPVDTNGSIPYPYPINTVPIDYGEEEEREEEKEEEKEREEEGEREEKTPPPSLVDYNFKSLIDHYEKHVKLLKIEYKECNLLSKMLDDYNDPKLIKKAMDIAVEKGKPHIAYINAILDNWRIDGITNYKQQEAMEVKRNSGTTTNQRSHTEDAERKSKRSAEIARRLKIAGIQGD